MTKKNILIIEDDMIHAMVLKSTIECRGYNVLATVSHGRDAVETAIRNIPDLIISDIILKGDVNGIEAMEQIQRTVTVPYIYLTALSDLNLEKNSTRPSAVISKPYDIRDLIDTIDSLLGK